MVYEEGHVIIEMGDGCVEEGVTGLVVLLGAHSPWYQAPIMMRELMFYGVEELV